MSDVIDWSKAPEWADKHGYVGMSESPAWLNDSQYTYVDGQQGGREFDFGGFGYSICSVRNVTSRPQSTPWLGEGLPPVGTVCEWKEKTGFQWVAATILFISESSVVCQRSDGFEWEMLTKRTAFRPIRTNDQIAADDRSKYCDRIYGVMCTAERPYNRSDMAEVLYDAGLRFTE